MHNFIGELFGTMVLVLLGDGVVANCLLKKSKGENGGWMVIASGWGFGVGIAVYIAGWVSGAHLNPAVTLGFLVIGKIPLSEAPQYLTGQILGAFLGAVIVWLAYLPHWKITDDPDKKLSCFCTMPAIRNAGANLLCEIIGTAMLLMGVLGIFNVHNSIGSGIGPYLVGILVFSIGLSLGGPTGYAINPARDLMPRIAHAVLPISGKRDSDWSYAWIPVVGPLIGSIVGAGLYNIIF